MIYGYIRVSTDKQTVENQRFLIQEFCRTEHIIVDSWVEETISGTKSPKMRKLGRLLDRSRPGDTIICSEISRLGRNLFMIMSILNQLMDKDVRVWTIKDNYRLGDNILSKVLAFSFGLSAEIERTLISERTKSALSRKKAEGVRLGRPKGKPNGVYKLDQHSAKILRWLSQGLSKAEIARRLHCSTGTLYSHLRRISAIPPEE